MHFRQSLAVLALAAASTAAQSLDQVTEVTSCHAHEETLYCIAGDTELPVVTDVDVDNAPESYSGCHTHGEELHCSGDGYDVTLSAAGSGSAAESSDHDHDHDHASEDLSTVPADEISCHTHAGVPHCVDADGNTVDMGCARPDYDYDVPLRIGLLFVILVTSGIGVFIPVVTERFTRIRTDSTVFVGLRQFGTGVIISTALVHLFTHAELYFSNECLGALEYEATTAAICMAGIFVTFMIEFVAHRFAGGHSHGMLGAVLPNRNDGKTTPSDSERAEVEASTGRTLVINTAVIEAGIIFHSILLGIVLVVAADSGFITLFVVILFHQAFEGVALGTRIAIMPGSFTRKVLLGIAFAITTPIGMAIGIGVLSSFNGNDPSTIIAIGTLNAFSAGILLWIGVTEMWFKEWFYGPLARAGPVKTAVGFVGLVAGLVIMSLIGKWA